tara:strand:+ start:30505 stop:30873 length:369 start_codon:yes stop_codon:yes gene_type:complete
MALIQNKRTAAQSAGAVSSPPKTITQQFYGTGGTLMYTVPAGRKFEGHAWNENNYPLFIVPADGQFIDTGTNSIRTSMGEWGPFAGQYYDYTPVLKLQAGDSIYVGPTNNQRYRITGTESDA